MNYPYDMPQYGTQDFSLEERVSHVMRNVYLRMTIGLAITAVVAMLAFDRGFVNLMAANSWVYWGLLIAQIGLVLYLSARITKISSQTAAAIFYAFSAVMGFTLSMIFAVYSPESICKTFAITAGTFGVMSVVGYTTNRDLTKMGSILFMALIGLIICSLVNIFWHSNTLGVVISFAGVIIFVGLTAYDTWQIKKMAAMMPAAQNGHLATIGALNLYLDFINLFMYLLRFLGSERD